MNHAGDWIYAGEGGAHVIFSHRPRQQFLSSFSSATHKRTGSVEQVFNETTLLRLVKQDIVCCMKQQQIHQSVHDEQEDSHPMIVTLPRSTAVNHADLSANDTSSLGYLVHIVAPSLHPFVDVPQLALVHCRLASVLGRLALQSGKIPPHRQESWQSTTTESCTHTARTNQEANMLHGLLLRDYRLPCLDSNNICPVAEKRVLSVEIKPKAGYTAVSPLVDPDRRAKYQYCRYQIVHGSGQTTSTTSYNPLDLFSRDANRIRCALQALVQQPRNNFRLWLAQTQSSSSSSCSSNNTSTEIVQANLPQDDLSNFLQQWRNGATEDTLTDVLSQILHQQDDFLSRIQSLQKLDVIDSDGAVRIYDHLVHDWLEGSHERARELLDAKPEFVSVPSRGDSSGHHRFHENRLLSSCPAVLLSDLNASSPMLDDYLATVECLQQHLLTTADHSNIIKGLHHKAVGLVQQMNVHDCLILLRLWLLSLAMCDLSFFVCMEVISEELANGTPPNEEATDTAIPQKTKQSAQGPGMLVLRIDGILVQIRYEIKVIDCDRKPAKKLKSRKKKEDFVFVNLPVCYSR